MAPQWQRPPPQHAFRACLPSCLALSLLLTCQPHCVLHEDSLTHRAHARLGACARARPPGPVRGLTPRCFFGLKLCYYLVEAFSDNHTLGQLFHITGSHRGLKCSFLASITTAVIAGLGLHRRSLSAAKTVLPPCTVPG